MRRFLAVLCLFVATSAAAFPPPIPLSGNTPFTANGGSVARAPSAYAADATNILSRLAQTASNTDFSSALTTALSGTVPVYLPQTGTPYEIDSVITFGAGSALICQPGVVIASVGNHDIFSVPNANVTISNCSFTQSGTGLLGVVSSDHFSWIGGQASGTGTLFFNTSSANYDTVQNVRFINGSATAIDIEGNANHVAIVQNEFQNNVGFGVRIDTGANNNNIVGNWTDQNRIELIGVTYQGYGNRIINNRAQGTGDNCISVTGYQNVVEGNIAYGCAFTGIYLYGDSNVATGNIALDNGQVHNPSFLYYDASNANLYTGIEINGQYGGTATNNVMSDNFSDDDQATPTQAYAGQIGAGYAAWTATTAYSAGTYISASGRIYKATVGGTSGSVAPSCTSGTCTDGTVTWAYQSTSPYGTKEPQGNSFTNNRLWRFGTAAFADKTINHNNVVTLEGQFQQSSIGTTGDNLVTAGWTKKAQTWTSGTAYTYGQIIYTSSGSNRYRCVNVGGTASVSPTHTSGTVTGADGIAWLYLGAGFIQPILSNNNYNSTAVFPFYITVQDSATLTVLDTAGTGTPEGKVTAPVGSTYRRSDGGAGTSFYVKESGSGATGWIGK